MTISSIYEPVQYNGNGVTTAFAFPYIFYDATDIIVTLTLISTGVDTVQVNPTDYSLTGGDGATGTVNFVSAPSALYRVTIERSIPYTQEDNYVENQAFPANTIETAFDRSAVRDQQLASTLESTLKFPATLSGSLVGILPQPEDGKALIWSGTFGTVENGPDAADIAGAQAAADAAIAAQAAAEVAQAAAEAAAASITLPLTVANGGTGATTLTGLVKGNGTSAFTAAVQGTDYYAPNGTDVKVADGGTNISSYTAGDTLYATGATTLTKLAIGAAGRPFVSSGTAPAWGNAISLQTTIATTSGSSISLSSSIPSGVRRITISFVGCSTNGTAIPVLQLGDSGGLETTGYTGSAAFAFNSSVTAAINLSSGISLGTSNAAANILQGVITLVLHDASTNTWAYSGNIGNSDAAGVRMIAGYKALTATLDRISLVTTDTWDAGSASISWEF